MPSNTVIAIVACAVIVAALVTPRYDLYQRDSLFDTTYTLNRAGFWSQTACKDAGKHLSGLSRCVQSTTWQELTQKVPEHIDRG